MWLNVAGRDEERDGKQQDRDHGQTDKDREFHARSVARSRLMR
jgi:hypothetical protein